MRSNREYDYFGNVLEYEYDYFASYSSTSTPKVLVLEYEYTSRITPSLDPLPYFSYPKAINKCNFAFASCFQWDFLFYLVKNGTTSAANGCIN